MAVSGSCSILAGNTVHLRRARKKLGIDRKALDFVVLTHRHGDQTSGSITKNQELFPSDDALLKLFYMAPANISKKWTILLRT